MAEQASNLGGIDVSQRLQVSRCPVCLGFFAVERTYLAKVVQDGTPLFCPVGHSYRPVDHEKIDGGSNVVQLNIELTATVEDLKQQLNLARRRLAELEPAVADRGEIRRRAGILAGRADRGDFGRIPCPICARVKANLDASIEHIRRCHGAKLAEMRPEEFA